MKESNKQWWKDQVKPMAIWAACMASISLAVGLAYLIFV